MQKILLPTNLSSYTAPAFSYAVKIAYQFRIPIDILHAYHLPIVNTYTKKQQTNISDFLQKANDVLFKEFIQNIQSTLLQKEINTVLFNYIFAKKWTSKNITQYANRQIDALIICPMKCYSSFFQYLLNESSMLLIHKLTCPLLVVSEKTQIKPIREITCVIDLKTSYNNLYELRQFISSFKSNIKFVYVHSESKNKSKQETIDKFKHKLDKVFTPTDYELFVYKHSCVVTALQNHIQQQSTDLIITINQQATWFGKWSVYNRTQQIIQSSQLPLLFWPERKTKVRRLPNRIKNKEQSLLLEEIF